MSSRQTLETAVERTEHVVGVEEASARGHLVEDVSDTFLKFPMAFEDFKLVGLPFRIKFAFFQGCKRPH